MAALVCDIRFTPESDIPRRDFNVRFGPILLQKSGTTGHRGWRERLELAACLSSP
jgi:hypothetical protein